MIEKKLASDNSITKELGKSIQELTEVIKDFIEEKQEIAKEVATIAAELSVLEKTVDQTHAIVAGDTPSGLSLVSRMQIVESKLAEHIKKLDDISQEMQKILVIEEVETKEEVTTNIIVEKMKTVGIVAPGVIALLSMLIEKCSK